LKLDLRLADLRAAATRGPVAGETILAALDEMIMQARAEARIGTRNRLLREAAEQIPGSRWARANRLQAEIAAASVGRPGAETEAVRGLVVAALKQEPAPRSVRQILRLLATSDTELSLGVL
jgi:hypothetical protein